MTKALLSFPTQPGARVVLALLLSPAGLFGATTGTTALATVQGSSATTAQGDYIASSGGLNTFYSYFLEVPPNLSQLVVDIFDADIGVGGSAEATANRDRARGGWNTSVNYSLINPTGTTVASLTITPPGGANPCAACDNAWQTLSTQVNPTAGHWELRVNQSSAVTGGNDINAIGIRAHDGNAGAGGTEINVYYDTFSTYGSNGPTLPRTYTEHPYITSGCFFNKNDFDWDSNSGTTGSTQFTSRSGAFSQTIPTLSGNNVWLQSTVTPWTSDALATDYGVWTEVTSIFGYLGVNGNYGQIYLGNTVEPGPPPAGQPLPNIFRIYLRTDAGAAPVKPYLEQLLTVTFDTGVNPPQVGQTTSMTVTVRLVNPTPYAITFSSPSNVVTANVPGSGVVYAGGAQISQGSLVSQPSVGGTGNVVWNPGSVAGGATALLGYIVAVSPTVAGQRLAVTGTPTGGGTTAQYVDETGNTSQARATYQTGPLCELAATEGLLTHAVVSSFTAYEDAGRVVVQWETSSEAGTLGFDLYRRRAANNGWERVNETLLVGLLHAPQGGTYRLVDEGVSPDDTVTYRLVEIESSGREQEFGPFQVVVEGERRDAEPLLRSYDSSARPASVDPLLRPLNRQTATARGGPGSDRSVQALKVLVRESGIYFVGASEMAALSGIPEASLRDWIRKGRLSLSHRGRQVSWLGAEDDSGLYFYGEAIDSLFTSENVYWLSRGAGSQVHGVVAKPGASATGGETFIDTRHYEEDRFAALVLPLDPSSDYWFWDFITSGNPTHGSKSFSLPAPALAPTAGEASLTLVLHGATDSGVAGEHHLRVSVNGSEIGETRWGGVESHEARFTFPQNLLWEGNNTVALTGVLDAGVPQSIFYLNSISLEYRRFYETEEASLLVRGDGNPVVQVSGFPSPEILLWELRDPRRPRMVRKAIVEPSPVTDEYAISFSPARPDTPYLAVEASGFLTSRLELWATPEVDLLSWWNRAEYLVITSPGLAQSAQGLANYRASQGLESLVVTVDQIYDTFNWGISDPNVIRDFLDLTRRRWRQTPRYVVLVGDGHYDYRDLAGAGGNLVPTLMAGTESGLYASDNLFVWGDGGPWSAVGRLPVLTAAELEAYLGKLQATEAVSGEAWQGRALIAADNQDRGADFVLGSERLAALLGGSYSAQRIYLSDLDRDQARQLLFEGISDGAVLVSYLGHGGLDRLADERLLWLPDVAALGNGERQPLMLALTCAVNRFELPEFVSLGEALVNQGDGGAAAVWSPSGLSFNAPAVDLGGLFVQETFGDEDGRLGDGVLAALRRFAEIGGIGDMVETYVLLGDPALLIPEPPEIPPGAPGGDPSEVE